jgi:hypothetical protein
MSVNKKGTGCKMYWTCNCEREKGDEMSMEKKNLRINCSWIKDFLVIRTLPLLRTACPLK